MNEQFLDNELVVLVDERDNETGTIAKLQAHELGLLHRAFSVFVFNSEGQMLLQRRALGKYHSPGLWSNTCCSHPRKGEKVGDAAARRLKEEMGMECSLTKAFHFIYKTAFANGLTEHEFDHVFVGTTDSFPQINKSEVEDWKAIDIAKLEVDMARNPANYTEWLKIAFPKVRSLFFANAELHPVAKGQKI